MMIASGSADCTVKIWDLSTELNVATLSDHTEAVTALCFSPCGTWLASGSADCSISIWECDTWMKLRAIGGHTSSVQSVAFDSASERLVSSSFDGTVRVWRLWACGGAVEELSIAHSSSAGLLCAEFVDDLIVVISAVSDVLSLCIEYFECSSGEQLSSVPRCHRVIGINPDNDCQKCIRVVGEGQEAAGVQIGQSSKTSLLLERGDGSSNSWRTEDNTLSLLGSILMCPKSKQTRVIVAYRHDYIQATLDGKATYLTGHTGRVISAAFRPQSTGTYI